MTDAVLANEPTIRLGAFLGIVNTVLLRLAVPVAAIGIAFFAEAGGWLAVVIAVGLVGLLREVQPSRGESGGILLWRRSGGHNFAQLFVST